MLLILVVIFADGRKAEKNVSCYSSSFILSIQLLNNKGECEIQLQTAPQLSIIGHVGSWGRCPVILLFQSLFRDYDNHQLWLVLLWHATWSDFEHIFSTWLAQHEQITNTSVFSFLNNSHTAHKKRMLRMMCDRGRAKAWATQRENSCTGVSNTRDH